MQRKKKLGNDSLGWIKDTKGSSQKTSDSSKKVKSDTKRVKKSEKLGVLKQYASEEAEVKKIKPKKAPPPIPDDSATIVKGKKEVTPKEEEIIEEISVREKSITSRSRKILLYPISRLKKTANTISDNFLSGIWLTGVTIGLVKRSADKIKKSIVGP